MILRDLKTLALIGAVSMLSACTINGGDTDDETATGAATTGGPTTTTPTTGNETTGGEAVDGPICVNFGGQKGVEAVVGVFVGNVLANESINAYFINKESLGDGGAQLVGCLNTQVGEAVGCAGVKYECMDMTTAHVGMGISTNDFNDLASDFSKAMDGVATITAENKMIVMGVLGGMAPMIVEDADNNKTTYQNIGRKPAINGVMDEFIGLVVADMSIAGFFGKTDAARLKTCLVRQVIDATAGGSSLGEIYGNEVTSPVPAVDPGVTTEKPCLDMKTSHASLQDPGDMMGIQYADFGALVGHLITALDNAGVGMTDKNAIIGALGPLCPDIVTVDPELCGT